MKILTVIGARPQFVKAAVFSRYIRENKNCGINEILVHTGQHYDSNMSDVFFDEMQIPRPDFNLHLGGGTHGKMTGQMLIAIEDLLLEHKPDALLVYGDTNSTLAGALAASKLHIPIAHVEAGPRTYIMAMPEEQNRKITDHLSTWLMCSTPASIECLKKEGIVDSDVKKATADFKRVSLTGDIMYEASLFYRKNNNARVLPELDGKEFVLMTVHRAENTDDINKFAAIVDAVNMCSDKIFVFPVHPRTRNILEKNNLKFGPHVKMIEPLGYFEMIAYEEKCYFILTDSGGVQKEAFFFKKPCIVLSDNTCWIELVENGWNTLVGTDTEKIVKSICNIKTPKNYPSLYGDGKCAEKIAKVLTTC